MPISIAFVDEQELRPLADAERQRIEQTLVKLLNDHQIQDADLSIAVLDDDTIQSYNRQYLDHDWPTDVISFLLSEEDVEPLEGQLLLSRQTADAVAAELPWDGDDELLLYAIHGTLHLIGYDDDDEISLELMRAAERQYLTAAGVVGAAGHPHFAEREKFAEAAGETTEEPIDGADEEMQ